MGMSEEDAKVHAHLIVSHDISWGQLSEAFRDPWSLHERLHAHDNPLAPSKHGEPDDV